MELKKMEWMEPVAAPPPKPLDSMTVDDLRFDFHGRPLNLPGVEPVAAELDGLYHHGDEPASPGYTIKELFWLARSTVPAQRAIALRTLAQLLRACHRGWPLLTARTSPAAVRAYLVQGGVLLLLRTAIDDTYELAFEQAMRAVHALLVPDAELLLLPNDNDNDNDDDDDLRRNAQRWSLHAIAAAPAYCYVASDNTNDDDDDEALPPPRDDKESVLQWAGLAAPRFTDAVERECVHDVVAALLDLQLLPRLRYLLRQELPPDDVAGAVAASPPRPALLWMLDVVAVLARHSRPAAKAVVRCDGLLEPLLAAGGHVLMTWQTAASRHWRAFVCRLLRVVCLLCQASRKTTRALLLDGGLASSFGPVLVAPAASRLSVDAYFHVVKLWRIALAYGVCAFDFLGLFPLLSQALLPPPACPSSLVVAATFRLCHAVLELVCTNDNNQSGVGWSHVSPLLQTTLACVDAQLAAASLDGAVLGAALDFLGAFLHAVASDPARLGSDDDAVLHAQAQAHSIFARHLLPVGSKFDLLSSHAVVVAAVSPSSSSLLFNQHLWSELDQRVDNVDRAEATRGLLAALTGCCRIAGQPLIEAVRGAFAQRCVELIAAALSAVAAAVPSSADDAVAYENASHRPLPVASLAARPLCALLAAGAGFVLACTPRCGDNVEQLLFQAAAAVLAHAVAGESGAAVRALLSGVVFSSARGQGDVSDGALQRLRQAYEQLFELGADDASLLVQFDAASDGLPLGHAWYYLPVDVLLRQARAAQLGRQAGAAGDPSGFVADWLRFALAKHSGLAYLPAHVDYVYLLKVFLMGRAVYAHSDVAPLLDRYRAVVFERLRAAPAWSESLAASAALFAVVTDAVDAFCADSFGDAGFAASLHVLLRQSTALAVRRHVWLEQPALLRLLAASAAQIDVDGYLAPLETDRDLLDAYAHAVVRQPVATFAASFLVRAAVHHLAAVLWHGDDFRAAILLQAVDAAGQSDAHPVLLYNADTKSLDSGLSAAKLHRLHHLRQQRT